MSWGGPCGVPAEAWGRNYRVTAVTQVRVAQKVLSCKIAVYQIVTESGYLNELLARRRPRAWRGAIEPTGAPGFCGPFATFVAAANRSVTGSDGWRPPEPSPTRK